MKGIFKKTNEKALSQGGKDETPTTSTTSKKKDVAYWQKLCLVLSLVLVFCLIYWFSSFYSSKTKLAEPIVVSTLADFVENSRSLSSDPVVVRGNLEDVYNHTTGKGRRKVERMLKNSDFFNKMDNGITINVSIKEFDHRRDNLYSLVWQETEYKNSQKIGSHNYKGAFLFERLTGDYKRNSIPVNPCGIYIKDLQIDRINPES